MRVPPGDMLAQAEYLVLAVLRLLFLPQDRSFTFILKTSPSAILLKKAAGEHQVHARSKQLSVCHTGGL